jgi:hypothetical protein
MKLRALILFGWTAWFAPAQEASCHPVEGDRISARDLAAALPEFRTAPPEALVGQAPLPGARRTFHAPELRALAHRFGTRAFAGRHLFRMAFAAAGSHRGDRGDAGIALKFPAPGSKSKRT